MATWQGSARSIVVVTARARFGPRSEVTAAAAAAALTAAATVAAAARPPQGARVASQAERPT